MILKETPIFSLWENQYKLDGISGVRYLNNNDGEEQVDYISIGSILLFNGKRKKHRKTRYYKS